MKLRTYLFKRLTGRICHLISNPTLAQAFGLAGQTHIKVICQAAVLEQGEVAV